MTDYLIVGRLITDRIRDRLPGVNILNALTEIREAEPFAPSVMVMIEQDDPGGTPGNANRQKVAQTWQVLVAARSADLSAAGELSAGVIDSLAGWKPEPNGFSPFRRVASRYRPDHSPNGVFYFPLAFQTTFIFGTE